MPHLIPIIDTRTDRTLYLREEVAEVYDRSPRYKRGESVVPIEGDGEASPPAPAVTPEPADGAGLDLVLAYAEAENIGAVKVLATTPSAALVLLGLEQAAATPRASLVAWLATKAGDLVNTAPVPAPPSAEPAEPAAEPVY